MDGDCVQIDEVKGRPILFIEMDEQVAGVQVVVQDAGFVHPGNEPAHLHCQALPNLRPTRWV